MVKKKFYITTAIDYLNAKPHIGHAYEKIIADVLARWHRLLGENVFFLTGTDEHGQKNYKTAKEQGKSPQEFADEMVVYFKDLCAKLNISNDRFIRTTEKAHRKTCQDIFKKLKAKGDVYKGEYEGLYCTGCEAYYTEKDLADGLCPIHKRAPEKLKEESYFFKMSNYQKQLAEHIEKHPEFIQPAAKRNEILNRLKEPLRDLSISRPAESLPWGVPVPGDEKHVLYVWLDALLNYISGIDYPKAKFKKYWPADAHIIGKDIAWFHTVIWPCELMSSGLDLPKTVHAHGFVNLGGEKLSKSRGIVVDPIRLIEQYGTDPVRYFFIREITAGEDGDFSYEALVERVNSDLADSLGNLLQRTLVLIQKNFDSEIPKPGKFEKPDNELIKASAIFNETNELMHNFEWNKAVEKIWDFVRKCNKYVNETEPWKLKDNKKRLGTVLYTLAESLRIISTYVSPFIPESAEKIAKQLGQKQGTFKNVKFGKKTKGRIAVPEILFKKFDAAEADVFSKLNLKVAKIEKAEDHPDADKLYVLQVDLGSEKRQLVAGLRQHFGKDFLVGKHVIVVTNLKPAKLKGIESNGMLLAAEKKGKVALLEAPCSRPGEPVFIEGILTGISQITIDDFQKIKLTINGKKALYKGKFLKTEKEEIKADIEDGAQVS